MKFDSALAPVTLLKRYKRFLADVRFADGRELTVHTPNTGSMMGCADPGSTIWIRNTYNPKRKYLYAWEMSETADGALVGVNTGMANHLVAEAITNGTVTELKGYDVLRTEVRYGRENSRVDILLEGHDALPPCYVEVKNVTAREGQYAIFPDAVTLRGQKHLRELEEMVRQGERAAIFFCIQRNDVHCFRPADEIDPDYGAALRQAVAAGVEALAYRAELSPEQVRLVESLEIVLDA